MHLQIVGEMGDVEQPRATRNDQPGPGVSDVFLMCVD